MIAYVDSSVVLRVVLRQSSPLAEWAGILTGVASGLVEVECMRTIDRLRAAGRLSADDALLYQEDVYGLLGALELVELSSAVLHRAAQSLAVPLGTLDAIHLASAETWRDSQRKELTFATHDQALGRAARANGFRVVGVEATA